MDEYTGAGCLELATFQCPANGSLSTSCSSHCASVITECAQGDGCQSGGRVVTVFFSVLIGAMALGQAAPSTVRPPAHLPSLPPSLPSASRTALTLATHVGQNALASGRGAIYKIMEVLHRQPTIVADDVAGARPGEVKVGG